MYFLIFCRCRSWVKAIKQEDLVYLLIEKVHQLKYVCNLHFTREDFSKTSNRLSKNAVATLNLTLKPLDDHLFDAFPYHIGQYPKHMYVCILLCYF